MRVRLTRAVHATLVISVCALLWLLANHRKEHFTKTCLRPISFQNNLQELSFRVHCVLDILMLTHCLCYGALWGQIRRAGTLPWESDVEFCTRNEELSALDETFIERLFFEHNLTLSYDSTEGVYSVTDEAVQPGATVKLVVFEKHSMVDSMRRIGWKRRVLPPNCDDTPALDCFPARLMETPLPLKKFGGELLPVPREDIEILKYHYAENWWLELLPYNC